QVKTKQGANTANQKKCDKAHTGGRPHCNCSPTTKLRNNQKCCSREEDCASNLGQLFTKTAEPVRTVHSLEEEGEIPFNHQPSAEKRINNFDPRLEKVDYKDRDRWSCGCIV